MKKIIISLSIIGAVAAIIIGATTAFFSDTETSTGNVFSAGALDLKIDNESYYFGEGEQLIPREDLSWELDDLTGHLFFNYSDLKPGDWGEDTVSIHVYDNDAWACVDLFVTVNDDVNSTEPELEDGDDEENPDDFMDGELAENIWFFFWADDGDNVYEIDERVLVQGPANEAIEGLSYALADSEENNVGEEGPLVGSNTYYIGKIWCYGTLVVEPVGEDDSGPLDRHSGVHCDGLQVNNLSQTDSMMADISFYAVQSRHNMQFECSQHSSGTVMDNVNLENKNESWDVIVDETWGNIVYSTQADTFYGTVMGQNLEPNAKYQITLNGPGTCTTTDDNLATFGDNLFQSGYWNDWAPGLALTCTGSPGEGVYNMNLIGDEYTVMTNASGDFVYPFNLTLPSGTYTGVKVLVKKTLDPFVSPWIDSSTTHTTNLYETAPIGFIVN